MIDGGSFDWTDPKFALYNEPDHSYHGLRYARDLGDLNHLAFIMRMRLVPLRNLYNAVLLPPVNKDAVEEGLRYINNDAC